MPHIILTGTYNCKNKGDAAMEVATAHALEECYGRGTVTIASPFPQIDGPFYAPIDIPVIRDRRRRLIVSTIQLSRLLLRRWLTKVFGDSGTRFLVDSEAEVFRKADLIVDLSGDMLTEDYGPHVAYSHYVPLLRALLQDRPFVICAQSIGPFKLTRPLARYILNRAAAITARDEITLKYLHSLNLDHDRFCQTADMAFLLPPSPTERIEEILRDEGLALGNRPILGVSVSALVSGKFRAAAPNGRSDFPAEIASALDRIVDAHDVDVLFVSHVTGPTGSKDDRIVARQVKAAMKRADRANVLDGDYRPEELKGLVARCTAFLGARMHANIAALSSGIPTVAISYSHKTPGIMASCGLSENVMPIEGLSEENVVSKVSLAFSNAAQSRDDLKNGMTQVRQNATKNVVIIEKILKECMAGVA